MELDIKGALKELIEWILEGFQVVGFGLFVSLLLYFSWNFLLIGQLIPNWPKATYLQALAALVWLRIIGLALDSLRKK